MTFAQMLLVPIVALMVADMVLTAKGLGRGYEEQNWLAVPVMERFGMIRGMLIYYGIGLLILGTVVVLFSSQWALPLVLMIEIMVAVWRNYRLVKQSPRQAEA